MIYFRDYEWLVVQGYTSFNALIAADDKKPEDLFWHLDLRCVAAGSKWRRVLHFKRPSLWMQITSFKPKLRDWRDLEKIDFWNFNDEEETRFINSRGYFDVDFYPGSASSPPESTGCNDLLWRVAGRDGGWFTVEMAALTDARSSLDALDSQPLAVLHDGRQEKVEPEADFWKKNAEIYLIENIPFGKVTVRVPRNVADPEKFALGRARALIGVPEPEHITVQDFLKMNARSKNPCSENIQQDIFVELHFNGFYED